MCAPLEVLIFYHLKHIDQLFLKYHKIFASVFFVCYTCRTSITFLTFTFCMTSDQSNQRCDYHNVTLHGTVIVGPKGQVVIPVSVRKELGIAPEDQLLTVVKLGKVVSFLKANEIQELHRALEEEMNQRAKQLLEEQKNDTI